MLKRCSPRELAQAHVLLKLPVLPLRASQRGMPAATPAPRQSAAVRTLAAHGFGGRRRG